MTIQALDTLGHFQARSAIPDSVVAQYDATTESSTGSISSISDQIGTFDLSGAASVISSGINGNLTYRFDGVDDVMSQSSTVASSEPIGVLMVAQQQEATQSNGFYFDGGSDLQFGLQDDNSDEYNVYRGGSGGNVSLGTATTSAHLIEIHGINSTDIELYQDGASQGTDSANSGSLDGITLADRAGGGNIIEIDIGEVVVMEAYTSQDLTDERNRLSDKWGVTA